MKTILHIITRPDDLARMVIETQRHLPDTVVQVADLHGDGTNYTQLVAQIFAADSVEVW